MTLRIAIPKGRLQEPTLAVFAAAGYDVPTSAELQSRRLVFDKRGVEWIFVKDGDVPVYVEHGAADAGVAGLDQILEHGCTAYQPVELPFGRCRMMLIAGPASGRPARQPGHVSCPGPLGAAVPPGETPGGWRAGRPLAVEDPRGAVPPGETPGGWRAGRPLAIENPRAAVPPGETPGGWRAGRPLAVENVATKYPRIARQYLDARALHADVIPLGGSVELAAVLRLTSHVIDLVETGETVRIHHLELQDTVAEITPRLIVGRTVYRTALLRMRELIARVEEAKDVCITV
jgi:ATP phosphoribosyltransferase